MGATSPPPRGNPFPRSASHRTTPSAAARPKTDPPHSATAWTRSTRWRGQEICLPGARRRAPHIHTRHRTLEAKHDRDPRRRDLVGAFPHQDAGDIRDSVMGPIRDKRYPLAIP